MHDAKKWSPSPSHQFQSTWNYHRTFRFRIARRAMSTCLMVRLQCFVFILITISFVLPVTADSIEGSLCPSPSNVTIRPTTFYTTLDSEALPLSEINVAMIDDDTASPVLKGILFLDLCSSCLVNPTFVSSGRKFRRSLRRVWRLRETTVANAVASRLSVAATISSGSNSSTETLMSTSIQIELRSASRGSADGASIACDSSRILKGICLTRGHKEKYVWLLTAPTSLGSYVPARTGETLREDRTFGCTSNRRTIAATTRTWLNRCCRIVKAIRA